MSDDVPELAWLSDPNGWITMGYGPFTRSAIPPQLGTAFYLQDFSLGDPEPWRIPSRVERWNGRSADGPSVSPRPPRFVWQAPDADPFSRVFQEIMASIRHGEFEKTVPVAVETGTCTCNPADFLRYALCRQPAPLMSYGWQSGTSGFAGATPELLLTIRDRSLHTMALAGTARSDDRDVFAVDEKEIREHEYVAQTLVAKLLDFGELHRHPREILHLGSIVHFLTRLTVELHQSPTPDEWVRRLHPTPALGPLPRTPSTMAKLLGWRERLGCPSTFGAPFGVWENGAFRAVVAIRGIWWDHDQLRIPAGCGIIEASRLVNEWRELRLKREAVKAFLGTEG
jgi:menaquinone-specific isochorismate synthase